MQYLCTISKNDRIISVHFQAKPFKITVIQVYAPSTNAKETEVEQFYEDLQDVLFIIGDSNEKVGNPEMPGVTGKFRSGVQNEAGQKLSEFCEENTLVISKHSLPTTQEMTLHVDITRWSILKSD